MAAVYGSATVAAVTSKGNAVAAQDMIGTSTALRAAANHMQNGHIGARQNQVEPDPVRAALIAANTTPAISITGTAIAWATATGTWS
jgi:hypothetical protein